MKRRTSEEIQKLYADVYRKSKTVPGFNVTAEIRNLGLSHTRYNKWRNGVKATGGKNTTAIILPEQTGKKKLALVMGSPEEIAAFAKEFMQ